jgi:hypothetical protein
LISLKGTFFIGFPCFREPGIGVGLRNDCEDLNLLFRGKNNFECHSCRMMARSAMAGKDARVSDGASAGHRRMPTLIKARADIFTAEATGTDRERA